MQATFIRRMHRGRSIRHPLYDMYRDFWRYCKPGGYRRHYKGQNGFFRAALATACEVCTVNIRTAARRIQRLSRESDVVVCDSKAFMDEGHRQVEPVDFLDGCSGPVRALLVANARPGALPPDAVLDRFDIIFKREPYIDRGRYGISNANRDKIRPTMLGCPLIRVTSRNVKRIDPAVLGYKQPPESFDHDVFFSGINTAKVREEFVEKLSGEDFDFHGGLQFRKRAPEISRRYAFPRLKKDRYIELTRKSRVGLVLEGEGPFTYRHLELWFLCSFMISTPHIRGLELPLKLREGRDYVCYENYEDLVDKIRYYLENRNERERIALAGRRMFERDFSYKKHGQYVRRCIEEIIAG